MRGGIGHSITTSRTLSLIRAAIAADQRREAEIHEQHLVLA